MVSNEYWLAFCDWAQPINHPVNAETYSAWLEQRLSEAEAENARLRTTKHKDK